MSFSSRLALAAATVTAAAGAIAAGPPETGYDRPGGAYANVPAKDAAECAVICAQDRICMSWTFRVTEYVGCSLKAVVPGAVADKQAISGVADRASDFLSLVSIAPPALAEPAPAAAAAASPPAASALAATEPPAPAADAAPELLGAPASVTEAAPRVYPVSYRPITASYGTLEYPRPILTIDAPVGLSAMAMVEAPTFRGAVELRPPAFDAAAVVLPPEPLAPPLSLAVHASEVIRVALRPHAALAAPAPALALAFVEEASQPLALPAPLVAQANAVSRAAARPLHTPIALASAATPIVWIDAPAAFDRPAFTGAAAAPRTVQPARSAINDHIVIALPLPAETAGPNVLASTFSSSDQAVLSPASATAPAGEEELLGAP